jgi:hypothetical protein
MLRCRCARTSRVAPFSARGASAARRRACARVPRELRPRIFRLTCDAEKPSERAHWDALSDGLTIHALNVGATWNEAWEALLGLLATDDAFNPPYVVAS